MKGSRRDFVHGALFGGLIASLISRAAFTFAEIESRPVDRRRFGRVGAEVSVLGLGLGAAFMDAFEHRLEAGHTLLESAARQRHQLLGYRARLRSERRNDCSRSRT
jgi:hypothetical protein